MVLQEERMAEMRLAGEYKPSKTGEPEEVALKRLEKSEYTSCKWLGKPCLRRHVEVLQHKLEHTFFATDLEARQMEARLTGALRCAEERGLIVRK